MARRARDSAASARRASSRADARQRRTTALRTSLSWTVSTEGDAITSGLRPRFPGRSIGTARFPFGRSAPLEDEHREDAGTDEQNLAQRAGVGTAAVQAGNQVRHRDVEEACGGKREEVRQQARHVLE